MAGEEEKTGIWNSETTLFVDGLPGFVCGWHSDAFVVHNKRDVAKGPFGFVIFRAARDAQRPFGSMTEIYLSGVRSRSLWQSMEEVIGKRDYMLRSSVKV